MWNTNTMVLIYQNSEGQRFFQHWQDLTEMGTLVDPETGDDMELIGWHSPQGSWVSVKDRLPELHQNFEEDDYTTSKVVLVLTVGRGLELWSLQRELLGIGAFWVDHEKSYELEEVTHWCEIPELP